MDGREQSELENVVKDKLTWLLLNQKRLLEEHFENWPWGICVGEFTAYLMDYKIQELDGRSINDELGKGHSQLRVHAQMPLANVLKRKRFFRKYYSTPPWNYFIADFLSNPFRRGRYAMCDLVCGCIKSGTRFFAPNPAQLWARFFLEAEEDVEKLRAGRGKPLIGYLLLSRTTISLINIPRNFADKLAGLDGLGLVMTNGDEYSLTDPSRDAFAQVKNSMGTEKDIRRWLYRYNLFFPPKNPYFGKPPG